MILPVKFHIITNKNNYELIEDILLKNGYYWYTENKNKTFIPDEIPTVIYADKFQLSYSDCDYLNQHPIKYQNKIEANFILRYDKFKKLM